MRRAGAGLARPLVGAVSAGIGLYGIKAVADDIKAFELEMVDLTVAARENGAWMAKTRSQILATSDAWNIGKRSVKEYLATIIRQTGDAKLATSTLSDMAMVGKATGAELANIGDIGIQLQNKLGIGGAQWKEAFGILASQAQKGSIELKDMAAYLPSVINFADQFGHKGMLALREYGAVFQVARRGSDSAAEAATSMSRMFDMIIQKRTKIEKVLNIKLKEGGAWLGMSEILQRISEGLVTFKDRGKDAEKFLGSVFGVRGKRTMAQFFAQQKRGWGADVGSYVSYQSLVRTADPTAIREMARSRTELSPIEKWNKSTNKLSNTIYRTMLPVINKLAKVMPTIAKAIKFVIDNFELFLAMWVSRKARSFFKSIQPTAPAANVAGLPVTARGGFGAPAPAGAPVTVPGTTVGAPQYRGAGLITDRGGGFLMPGQWQTKGAATGAGGWVSRGRSGGKAWQETGFARPTREGWGVRGGPAARPGFGARARGALTAARGRIGAGVSAAGRGLARGGGLMIKAMGGVSLIGQLFIAGSIAKQALDNWIKGKPSDAAKEDISRKKLITRQDWAAGEIRRKREEDIRTTPGMQAAVGYKQLMAKIGDPIDADTKIRRRKDRVTALQQVRMLKDFYARQKQDIMKTTKYAGTMPTSMQQALFPKLTALIETERTLVNAMRAKEREDREQRRLNDPKYLAKLLIDMAIQVEGKKNLAPADRTDG
jgi:hypothetical protein